MTISTVEQLDAKLTTPSAVLIDHMREWQGDLMLLGAGGKMGPTLAVLARNALDAAGNHARVIAVSRFSDATAERSLNQAGIDTIRADLLGEAQLAGLPDVANVLFMAAMKFGATGQAPLTWAMNTYLPARVAARFHDSRIVAFSSGNVYPLSPLTAGGPTEADPTGPVGEYAQSVLGRERMFQYFSELNGTPTVLLRLNYAVELRYGVLVDLATAISNDEPIDLAMGAVNVIWQGDANEQALRAFGLCSSPADILNITGPETVSVRRLAERLAARMNLTASFVGEEQPTALLNDASRSNALFGYPSVSLATMIELVADWIAAGGATHGKPTKFQVRSGEF